MTVAARTQGAWLQSGGDVRPPPPPSCRPSRLSSRRRRRPAGPPPPPPADLAHAPLASGGGRRLAFLHSAPPHPLASMTAAALLLPFNSPSATAWLFPRARPLARSPLPAASAGGGCGGGGGGRRMLPLAPALRGPLHLLGSGGSGGGGSGVGAAAAALLAHPLGVLLATARRRLALAAAAATALTVVRVRRLTMMRAQGGGGPAGDSAAAAAGEPLGALSMALLEPMAPPPPPPTASPWTTRCRDGSDGRGVAVLVIADRSSASAATAWGTRLLSAVAAPAAAAAPRIAVAAVIDVSALPALAASVVRQYLSALTDVHVLDAPASGARGRGGTGRTPPPPPPPPLPTAGGVAVLDSAGAARGEMGFVPGRVRLVVVDLDRGRILRAQDVGPTGAGGVDDDVLRRVLDVAYAAAAAQS